MRKITAIALVLLLVALSTGAASAATTTSREIFPAQKMIDRVQEGECMFIENSASHNKYWTTVNKAAVRSDSKVLVTIKNGRKGILHYHDHGETLMIGRWLKVVAVTDCSMVIMKKNRAIMPA